MRYPKSKQGFSLLEAIFAVAVFAIILTGTIPAFLTFSQTNRASEVRAGAVAAAQEVMDGLRQREFGAWPESGTITEINSGIRTYGIKIEYCTDTLEHCGVGSRHARLEVSFANAKVYEVETVYTRFN